MDEEQVKQRQEEEECIFTPRTGKHLFDDQPNQDPADDNGCAEKRNPVTGVEEVSFVQPGAGAKTIAVENAIGDVDKPRA